MLTVEEFAKKHGLSTQRVYQLIGDNRLKVKKVRGVKLVLDAELPPALKLGRPKFRSTK